MDGMQSTNCVKKIPLIMVLLCVFIGGCIEVSVHVKGGGGGSSSNPDDTELPPGAACSLSEKFLTIVGYQQENVSVCWAANSQMILNYKRRDSDLELLTQCSIVDWFLNRPSGNSCCGKMEEDLDCYKEGLPEWVLAKEGFTFREFKDPNNKEILWAKITREICAERPFVLAEYFREGGGHSSVIYGFGDNGQNTGRWVDLYDPNWPPISTPLMGESDLEQVNFDVGIYFVPSDPIRKEVYFTFDIQPQE